VRLEIDQETSRAHMLALKQK